MIQHLHKLHYFKVLLARGMSERDADDAVDRTTSCLLHLGLYPRWEDGLCVRLFRRREVGT